ncbi:hypothetical protein L3X38_004862 [Prunus dulcis]|uniref:KIB1-4 beta-propeller domain-containing protein n=1 Tax=Prunus dulcis TaxID=3755 RepID=A0AAD4ZPV2_PRUDU|nr:hypothetical protein L3X38_004862 [Prunus dulcis]
MAMACTTERKTTPPNRNRWADELLPELFELILKKLTSNVLDIIRFKAVCSSWNRAAARSYTSAPLPQYPWLMAPIPKSPPIDHESRCFFSLAENKVYKMDWNWKKAFHGDGASCLGLSHGGLAIKEVNTEKKTYNEYEEIVHLFNPISRERLMLPLGPKYSSTKSVVLSSDPSRNNNFVVVVIHEPMFEGKRQHSIIMAEEETTLLLGLRRGDNAAAWTNLSHGSSCADMVFHNGHLFTLSIVPTIQVWDFRGTYDNNNYPTKIMNFEPSINGNVNSMAVDEWLVESMGELSFVGKERLGNDTRGAVKFFVYKLNIAAKTLEKVESLRDCALFLARNQSAMSFSLSTKELPRLKENSIYFTDLDHMLKLNESRGDNFYEIHVGGVYNLETKVVETYYPTRAPVSNKYWNSPPFGLCLVPGTNVSLSVSTVFVCAYKYVEHLRCTDTSVWRGMLVSDTAPIRYGTDTAPIRIRYATWRIVDLYGMLTSRYGSDTSSIRSRYGIDTSGGKNENICRLWGTEAKQKRRKKKKKKKEPSLAPSAAAEGAFARTQQAAQEKEIRVVLSVKMVSQHQTKDSGSKKNEGKDLGMVAPQDKSSKEMKSSKKMKFASSSAETEPTSQTTISDDSKTGRGMSTMPRVVKRKLQKLRPIVEYNKRGKGIGQAHSEMQSYIGVLARSRVPLVDKKWSQIPKDIKEQIWEAVDMAFVVGQGCKNSILASAAKKWKDFKSTLTRHYILPYTNDKEKLSQPQETYKFIEKAQWDAFVASRLSKDFESVHSQHAQIREKLEYNHRLSRKGYAGLEDQLEETMPGVEIDRSTLWKRARQDKHGNIPDPKVAEKAKLIDELQKQVSEGKVSVHGSNDVLTMALGRASWQIESSRCWDFPKAVFQFTQTTEG